MEERFASMFRMYLSCAIAVFFFCAVAVFVVNLALVETRNYVSVANRFGGLALNITASSRAAAGCAAPGLVDEADAGRALTETARVLVGTLDALAQRRIAVPSVEDPARLVIVKLKESDEYVRIVESLSQPARDFLEVAQDFARGDRSGGGPEAATVGDLIAGLEDLKGLYFRSGVALISILRLLQVIVSVAICGALVVAGFAVFKPIVKDIRAERVKFIKSQRQVATQAAFLAEMAHELRTPLNGIIGNSELLQESDALDDWAREEVDIVVRCGESLLTIVNDILDSAKLDEGKMMFEKIEFDVRDIIDLTVHLFAAKASENATDLIVRVRSDVPSRLLGDPTRVRQVLHNLISNAIKFTKGGRVAIRVSIAEPGAPESAAAVADAGQPVNILFEVLDSGIGLTEAQIGRLFQPFVQADITTTRQYGGSGLGLSICRKLVEGMGGEIGAKSRFGHGSTFFFTLPLGALPPHAAGCSVDALKDVDVYVCSANPDTVDVLQELLVDNWHMRVVVCATGRAWLKKLAHQQPGPDSLRRFIIVIDSNFEFGPMTLADFRLIVREGVFEAVRPEIEAVIAAAGPEGPHALAVAKCCGVSLLLRPILLVPLVERAAYAEHQQWLGPICYLPLSEKQLGSALLKSLKVDGAGTATSVNALSAVTDAAALLADGLNMSIASLKDAPSLLRERCRSGGSPSSSSSTRSMKSRGSPLSSRPPLLSAPPPSSSSSSSRRSEVSGAGSSDGQPPDDNALPTVYVVDDTVLNCKLMQGQMRSLFDQLKLECLPDGSDMVAVMSEKLNDFYARAKPNGTAEYYAALRVEVGLPSLILMDNFMTQMNGLDATREIRAMEKARHAAWLASNDAPTAVDVGAVARAAIVLLSAADDVNGVTEAGCDAYIGKPISKGQTLALINKFVVNTSVFSPATPATHRLMTQLEHADTKGHQQQSAPVATATMARAAARSSVLVDLAVQSLHDGGGGASGGNESGRPADESNKPARVATTEGMKGST